MSPELYLPFREGFSADSEKHAENIRRLETWARQTGGGGSSEWDAVITKLTDESISSNVTVQDDDELTFPMLSGVFYEFDTTVIYDGDSAGDLRLTFAPSVGSMLGHYLGQGVNAAGTGAQYMQTTSWAESVWGCVGAANHWTIVRLQGVARNNADATFALKWAQGTSSATATIVRAGSRLRHRALT